MQLLLGSPSSHKPKGLPFIQELTEIRQMSRTPDMSTEVSQSPLDEGPGGVEVLKIGNLMKTSQSTSQKSVAGHSRQRKFRLTPMALEYLNAFSHVSFEKQFSSV